jgi:hypothetical protein
MGERASEASETDDYDTFDAGEPVSRPVPPHPPPRGQEGGMTQLVDVVVVVGGRAGVWRCSHRRLPAPAVSNPARPSLGLTHTLMPSPRTPTPTP